MSIARASQVVPGYVPAPVSAPGVLRLEPGERRRQPRLACPPLFVDGLSALVHDVSPTGISILVDEPLVSGDVYRLILTDAINESAQMLEAEVVWYNGERAGLRWYHLNAEQNAWLRSRFQAWMGALEGASRR
jgi:hypothetical protein